jgi:hypothetical protein
MELRRKSRRAAVLADPVIPARHLNLGMMGECAF